MSKWYEMIALKENHGASISSKSQKGRRSFDMGQKEDYIARLLTIGLCIRAALLWNRLVSEYGVVLGGDYELQSVQPLACV